MVIAIFVGSQVWMKNYDIRYTKMGSEITTVKNIVKKPAGTYPMSKVVGNVVCNFPVYKPAHTVLAVEIQGKIYEIENFNLKKGDEVKVCYNKPAYLGKIFALRIVGKNMECDLGFK